MNLVKIQRKIYKLLQHKNFEQIIRENKYYFCYALIERGLFCLKGKYTPVKRMILQSQKYVNGPLGLSIVKSTLR